MWLLSRLWKLCFRMLLLHEVNVAVVDLDCCCWLQVLQHGACKNFFLAIPCFSNNFRNVANSFPATLGGCGPNGVCALVRPARPKSATPGGGVKVRARNEVLLEYLKI